MDIRIHEERGAGEGTIVPKGQVVPFWPLTDSNRLYLTVGKECRSVMFCYKRSDSIVLKLTNKVRRRERRGREGEGEGGESRGRGEERGREREGRREGEEREGKVEGGEGRVGEERRGCMRERERRK